ncbi:hypothetical protein [Vibrio viridaestus]|uniref:Calcium-binding protein n=1 Tax=Vibrio viridaestus TaxID=2487322 RepID=A0A3N9THX4_9VIBR|nr:hypothetical protein [Vibrio viridaestus]RQW63898.1 hypothetical protein EES38_04635 [Vibrio viridaestus]
MSEVLVGTASSEYLTVSNQVLNNNATVTDVDYTDLTAAVASSWNAKGEKSVSIDSDKSNIYVQDFVDVSVNADSDTGANVTVVNAKRGSIETGNGDDSVYLSVYSNNNHWSNSFDIDTGAGDDTVVLTNTANSENTSFHIELGSGNDSLDVSGLLDPFSSASRFADGGDGLDTLTLSGEDSVSFDNFEVIKGSDSAFSTVVTLSSDLLEDNDSAELGLVFNQVDLQLSDDVSVSDVNVISDDQASYLASLGLDSSDYVSVEVAGDDGTYTVLTDDSDYSIIA